MRSRDLVQRAAERLAWQLELCLKKSRFPEQQSPSCDQEAPSSSVTQRYATLPASPLWQAGQDTKRLVLRAQAKLALELTA